MNPRDDLQIEGVDVSRYQDDLDTVPEWRDALQLDDGRRVQLVIVKATEGLTYTSPTYEAQINSAEDAGATVAAYHFLRLGDGRRQAEHFLTQALTRGTPRAAMLDIEWPSKWGAMLDLRGYTKAAQEWCAIVCQRMPVAVYTSRKEALQLLTPGHGLGHFSLLAPAYGDNDGDLDERDTAPRLPHGWSRIWGWQYTSRGRLRGYAGHVDRFRCRSVLPATWIAPLA